MKDFFFYKNDKIEAPQETLTGGEIKILIKAKDSTVELAHELIQEGQGHHEDKVILDHDPVNLTRGHGEGPKHFFLRPPTNFGTRIC